MNIFNQVFYTKCIYLKPTIKKEQSKAKIQIKKGTFSATQLNSNTDEMYELDTNSSIEME